MKSKDCLSKPTAIKTSIRTSEILLLEEHSESKNFFVKQKFSKEGKKGEGGDNALPKKGLPINNYHTSPKGDQSRLLNSFKNLLR